jgi:hypothetical protein
MRIPVISRLAVLAALGAVAATGTAQAETWYLGGSGGIKATGATMTFSSLLGNLEARAYIVDTNNGSANIPTTDVLNPPGANGATMIQAAQLAQYSSGLGVTTTSQGGDNGTGSPEHTMDNQLGYEFIVFRLPDNQAFTSLQLDSFSGGAGTFTGDADVTAWIGGDASITGFDWFNGKTFGSVLDNPNTSSLSGNRFQQLNLKTTSTCATGGEATNAAGNSAGCNDVVYTLDTPVVETPAPAGSDAAGKWLIVAAAMTVNGSNLVDRDDDVKITKVTTTTQAPPPPPGNASEPGTLAMLLMGAGYAFWRRRRNAAERSSTED